MPIMRNPFRKQDENARPVTPVADQSKHQGDANSKAIEIQNQRPIEYKLSEINDSGVFLPPSPPQRKGFWSTNSFRSTDSSVHRCAFDENEQFNISRESFDSYRRSFDISARSPIVQPSEQRSTRASMDSRGVEWMGRASLDSRGFERYPTRSSLDSRSIHPPPPRTSNSFQRPSLVPAETKEEADNFEDVDISDTKPQPAKKRGLFARMVDGVDLHHGERPSSSSGDHNNKSSWHHFGGRKRGQSGQGSELGVVPVRPVTPKAGEPQPHKVTEPSNPTLQQSKTTESKPLEDDPDTRVAPAATNQIGNDLVEDSRSSTAAAVPPTTMQNSSAPV